MLRDYKGLQDTVVHKGHSYNAIETGRICSSGYICGTYASFLVNNIPYVQVHIRTFAPIDLIGDYEACKHDQLAGIIFVQAVWGNRSGVYTFDMGHSDEPSLFLDACNNLYWHLLSRDYSVQLVIDDGILVAKLKGKNAIITDIQETREYFMISGYRGEHIRVPKVIATPMRHERLAHDTEEPEPSERFDGAEFTAEFRR